MGQYFASNFTFFFCLTWLFPYLQRRYQLSSVEAGFFSATPLVCGAIGNWAGGIIVDAMYKRGHPWSSRQLPGAVGFVLAAVGLLASLVTAHPLTTVIWLSVAIFGADMTLPPSWAFCIDIGRRHAGVVAGTMNMAGNLGSFVTSLAFPYLLAATGSSTPFFLLGAALNVMAAVFWLNVRPNETIGTA
jgi:ACS family glucarate transporter-like MFS transporter